MTLANTFAAKASVAFVAIAMALMAVAPAQAATAEELQAQIDALMAQISGLQGQTTSSESCGYTFTRALTVGSQGADVTALQNYLIGAGHAIPAGATGYFGAQTQAAVAAWQTANGVTPAAGYFGPVSQAKYAMVAACADDSDDDMSDDDSDDDSDSTDLQGEASLGDVESSNGDDTSIEEGQEAAPVAEFEVEFEDGDAKISRIDLTLVRTSANPGEDPWDTFEEVSLWVDGDEVASMAADDEDEYLDEDDGSLRFSGLDIVGMEDEAVTIIVGVTVQGSVDNLPADWEVDMTGLRFEDADEVTTTETVSTDAVDFDIDEEGSDDELVVKSSAEDPDATTLQVEDDSNSDWMTVFAFDLDTDDSTNDIEINELRVDLAATTDGTTATSTAHLINDVQLVVDGEVYDDVTIAHGTTGSSTFDIDGDLVIDAGERVTVEFQVEFKELPASLEGATVQGTAAGANVDAEGADDVTATGASTGDEHSLRTSGAILEPGDMSESKDANSDTTTGDDEGVFTIEFDVTAFESDIFVTKSAAVGTSTANGVNYRITNGSGITLAGAGTTTASLSSTADTESGQYKVSEGETETFTLTVTHDPSGTGFFGALLHSFNFKSTAGAPNVFQRALPSEDYETDPLSI